MEDDSNQEIPHWALRCQSCGVQIELNDSSQASCPHCGTDIVWANQAESSLSEDATEADEQDELSSLHIRQIASLRRGAYRARSYCIIGMVVLIVCAMQLLVMTAHSLRSGGRHLLQAAFAGVAIVAIFFAWRLAKRVMEFTHELKQPLLTDPVEPPDFSTLSDGSQHVRNLEQME